MQMFSERGVDAKNLISHTEMYHNCNEKINEQKAEDMQCYLPPPPPVMNGEGKYPEGALFNISINLFL